MSKIKRDSIQIDPCARSIQTLRDRCEAFFNKHLSNESSIRVYVDDPHEKSLGIETNEVIDFVLFGNAFKKFFESGNWIAKKLRIWVLSKSNKDMLDSFLDKGIEVNVIPRYLLFSKPNNHKEISIGDELNFIFAGRLSAQKNIESLLFFLKYYNEKYSVNSTLSLYGEFENTYHEDFGRRTESSYRDKINKLISELNLAEVVNLEGFVEGDKWISSSKDKSVFISLSTFICEDYGCAVAEAQEEGLPCVLSDHGGHRDVVGDNVVKVPCSFISNSHSPLEAQSQSVRQLVDNLENFSNEEKNYSDDLSNNIIELEELDRARRSVVKKLGASISLIHSDYIGAFSDTVEGSIFIRNIKKFLSKGKDQVSIILFDVDQELSSDQISSFQKAYSKINLNNVQVNLISSKDLFFKDVIKILFESKRIYIIKDRLNLEKVENYLESDLQIAKKDICIV